MHIVDRFIFIKTKVLGISSMNLLCFAREKKILTTFVLETMKLLPEEPKKR